MPFNPIQPGANPMQDYLMEALQRRRQQMGSVGGAQIVRPKDFSQAIMKVNGVSRGAQGLNAAGSIFQKFGQQAKEDQESLMKMLPFLATMA